MPWIRREDLLVRKIDEEDPGIMELRYQRGCVVGAGVANNDHFQSGVALAQRRWNGALGEEPGTVICGDENRDERLTLVVDVSGPPSSYGQRQAIAGPKSIARSRE